MFRTRLMVASLVVVAAACSSNDTTATSDEATITSDISAAVADGAAEDVDVMTTMDGSVALMAGPGDWRPSLTGCTFAGGSFTCPAVTRHGLSVTRTITLLDISGGTQSAYDPLTTASIHVVADIAGDRTHGPWTAAVTRHRDFTITGLAGTEATRTVNGTGSETITNARDTHNPRTYNVVGSSVATNVVLPVRSSDGGSSWPLSGTLTRTMTITVTAGGNAGHVTTRTVTITFNGTSTVTANVNGTEFTIDLSERTATPRG